MWSYSRNQQTAKYTLPSLSFATFPVHVRGTGVWVWWGNTEFMWHGTGLDTHH